MTNASFAVAFFLQTFCFTRLSAINNGSEATKKQSCYQTNLRGGGRRNQIIIGEQKAYTNAYQVFFCF